MKERANKKKPKKHPTFLLFLSLRVWLRGCVRVCVCNICGLRLFYMLVRNSVQFSSSNIRLIRVDSIIRKCHCTRNMNTHILSCWNSDSHSQSHSHSYAQTNIHLHKKKRCRRERARDERNRPTRKY